jgi:hypothetical protein
VSSTIYNDEARRHGATESRRPVCDDGRTHGGGALSCCGGIDVGTMKFMRIFTLKIAQRLGGGDGFCSMCMRYSLRVC